MFETGDDVFMCIYVQMLSDEQPLMGTGLLWESQAS